MNYRVKNIVGQRFGRLTAIAFAGSTRKAKWTCRCDCGSTVEVDGGGLRGGHTRSCGCLKREVSKEVNTIHGFSTRERVASEYKSWAGIKDRCTNPKRKDYPRYGGRGVRVCDRWLHSFENFIADMGEKPSSRHSIERLNNDGDYEPRNCVWATSIEQQNNKRTSRFITSGGRTQTVETWAREIGVKSCTLRWRLNHGWSDEETVNPKTRKWTKQ